MLLHFYGLAFDGMGCSAHRQASKQASKQEQFHATGTVSTGEIAVFRDEYVSHASSASDGEEYRKSMAWFNAGTSIRKKRQIPSSPFILAAVSRLADVDLRIIR